MIETVYVTFSDVVEISLKIIILNVKYPKNR